MNPTVAHIALQFAQIEGTDYRSIIRFYEENSLDILAMDEAEKNFYNYEYVMALFNLGRYNQVLALIDELIEFVFLQEMEYADEKTYEELIFKKSAALLNSRKTTEAERIASDLIRMNPGNKDFSNLFLKISRQEYYINSKILREISIILILTASILSMFAWSLKNTVEPEFATNLFYSALGLNLTVIAFIAYHMARAYWLSRVKLREVLMRRK